MKKLNFDLMKKLNFDLMKKLNFDLMQFDLMIISLLFATNIMLNYPMAFGQFHVLNILNSEKK
jgi:hypothetical protein